MKEKRGLFEAIFGKKQDKKDYAECNDIPRITTRAYMYARNIIILGTPGKRKR